MQRDHSDFTLEVASFSPMTQSKTVLERDLRTRLCAFPNDAQSWYLLSCVLESNAEYTEAESALRRAIELNPRPPHFHRKLASVLEAQGSYKESLNVLRDAGLLSESDLKRCHVQDLEATAHDNMLFTQSFSNSLDEKLRRK